MICTQLFVLHVCGFRKKKIDSDQAQYLGALTASSYLILLKHAIDCLKSFLPLVNFTFPRWQNVDLFIVGFLLKPRMCHFSKMAQT